MEENFTALDIFHPIIKEWFITTKGNPTHIQSQVWPLVSKDEHVLISAPTGSGKTLAAFLWCMHLYITKQLPLGITGVIYVSPLKALNNDVQKNLIKPYDELKNLFKEQGNSIPDIQIVTRSGDTPQTERRRMLQNPPEILITTPESLNILLTNSKNIKLFTHLHNVIIDEVHSIANDKRGVHLITAIERLTRYSGEFQRIALSATVFPLERVGDFIGGYLYEHVKYKKRSLKIIQSKDEKHYDIKVSFPESGDESEQFENISIKSIWPDVIRECTKHIKNHKSTLIFVNNRRFAEKITRLINEEADEQLAYAHHGSLSKEIRLLIEDKLKKGELKAIVATNSLELGIDIGDLDLVLLIESPASIMSAIQKVGRSGHTVGVSSKGIYYPLYGRDLIDAAVSSMQIIHKNIEPVFPIINALDVLAQVLLSMTVTESWDIDELYNFIRQIYNYNTLQRKHFDLVIGMLAGRYSKTPIKELRSFVTIDSIDNVISAKQNATYTLYLSGGTIPDLGYFDLRIADNKSKIGELDEEFVWERTLGETFALGTQAWKIVNITHNDVEVVPTAGKPGIIPFWRADVQSRNFHYAMLVSEFLKKIDSLNQEALLVFLKETTLLDESAQKAFVEYISLQKNSTQSSLPHRHHILLEHYEDPANMHSRKQVIMHTLWGNALNKPYSLALAEAWEKKFDYPLEVFTNNDAILFMLPHDINSDILLQLVHSGNIESLLREKLESTGFFGARFRENAARALLLPRSGFNKRLPLWLNRLRSKKLLEAVMKFDDFPILIETWRTCLQDQFDLSNLKVLLDELHDGTINISETTTRDASPFASSLIWRQTNKYMYDDDTPNGSQKSSLTDDLIKNIIHSEELRPSIDKDVIEALDEKLKRTIQGYEPQNEAELLEWIYDRLLIPEKEWDQLLAVMDLSCNISDIIKSLYTKIAKIYIPNNELFFITAIEQLPHVSIFLDHDDYVIEPISELQKSDTSVFDKNIKKIKTKNDDENLLSQYDLFNQWVSLYAKISPQLILQLFKYSDTTLVNILETLKNRKDILYEIITDGEEKEICTIGNMEILLRMMRQKQKVHFTALPLESLQLFLAIYQNIVPLSDGMKTNVTNTYRDLQNTLDQLFGFQARPDLWESALFPVRHNSYEKEWLDQLLSQSELIYFAVEKNKITFSFKDDYELFNFNLKSSKKVENLFPDLVGKYSLFDLQKVAHIESGELLKQLNKHFWSGYITNDSYNYIRKGNYKTKRESEFYEQTNTFGTIHMSISRSSRGMFNKWKSERPLEGYWSFLRSKINKDKKNGFDKLEQLETEKELVRQLLRRYGVLFRELIFNESKVFQWSRLFKALRLMELSGEIISGYFFEDIPGIQFVGFDALRILQQPLPEDAIYWFNAHDPISLCGIPIEQLKALYPPRLHTTFLVCQGNQLKMICKKNFKDIIILVNKDDPELFRYFSIFSDQLNKHFYQQGMIQIKTINDTPALKSEYLPTILEFGFKKYSNSLVLEKQYY